MKNIDNELIKYVKDKINNEYKDDVALLIGNKGSCKILTDKQNISLDFFAPVNERGYDLADTFIIGDIHLMKVNLNGHDEWISIRGKDKDAPVLLFLAGGPGGTQMAATRYSLSNLEDNFVVVSWDQPGSGKSYKCMKQSDITPQTYVEDGISLTEYLRDRFNHKKIYLIGESWGSALGIFLVKEKPEYYAGFIGTGQMVNFAETERLDYKKAIEIAEEKGDEKIIK